MSSEESVIRNVVLLSEEFLARTRRGERPSLDEYVEAYPELAEKIQELFPTLVMMDDLAQPSVDGANVYPDDHPDKIGDYKVIRVIGNGGMGVVYEADQISLNRQVALKVLPSRVHSGSRALDRFLLEAQAAARLHHDNIVPVFDVGEDCGCWYYTMQLIPGQGLDRVLHGPPGNPDESEPPDLVDGGGRSTVVAANLDNTITSLSDPGLEGVERSGESYFRGVADAGVQVAEALAYAHSEGIIHRDIKPSNLLLEPPSKVWVTDFGLAKADGNDITQSGEVVGTLRYMSPERFSGWSDPRSDVYSLGATLYELMVRRPPFDSEDRVELIRMITHDLPALPRSIDSRAPRDLELIVLKCLEKEPAARYQTATDVAADLRRFIDHKPITAKPASRWDHVARWCRRNPGTAMLSCALSLSLVIGLGSSLGLLAQATNERDQARLAVELTIDALNRGFREIAESNLMEFPGTEGAHKRVLVVYRDQYEKVISRLKDAPKLQRQLGVAYHGIGKIEHLQGNLHKARRSFEIALQRLEAVNPRDAELLSDLGACRSDYSALLADEGNLIQAEQSVRRAIDFLEKAESIRESFLGQRRMINALTRRWTLLTRMGRSDEVVAVVDRIREIAEAVDESLDERSLVLATAYNDTALVCLHRGQIGESVAWADRALKNLESYRRLTWQHARAHYAKGHAFYSAGRFSESIAETEQAVRCGELGYSTHNANPSVDILCQSLLLQADTFFTLGRMDRAWDSAHRAVSIASQRTRWHPWDTDSIHIVVDAQQRLASIEIRSGKASVGQSRLHAILEDAEDLVQQIPDCARYRDKLADVLESFSGLSEEATDQIPERWARALVIRRELVTEFPDLTQYRFELTLLLHQIARHQYINRQYDSAERLLTEATELQRELVGSSDQPVRYLHNLARHLQVVGLIGLAKGERESGAAAVLEAIEIVRDLRKQSPTSGPIILLHAHAANTMWALGQSSDGAVLEESMEAWAKLEDLEPGLVDRVALGGTLCNYGTMSRVRTDVPESLDKYNKALDYYDQAILKLIPEIGKGRTKTARSFLWNSTYGAVSASLRAADISREKNETDEFERRVLKSLEYLRQAADLELFEESSRRSQAKKLIAPHLNRPEFESFSKQWLMSDLL